MSLHKIYQLENYRNEWMEISRVLKEVGIEESRKNAVAECIRAHKQLWQEKNLLCEKIALIPVDLLCKALDIDSDDLLIHSYEIARNNGTLQHWFYVELSKLQQVLVSHLLNTMSHE